MRLLKGGSFVDDQVLRELGLQWLPSHLSLLFDATRKYSSGESGEIVGGLTSSYNLGHIALSTYSPKTQLYPYGMNY